MKKLRMILIVFFIFGLSATGYSSEGCLLFNGTFERSTKTSTANVLSVKNSETQIGQFKAVDGGVLVKVYNGAQEDDAQKVSSATIFINGKKVIGPSNFNQNMDYIEKMVEVNGGDNSLEVSLKSKPGGKIKVEIVQPNVLALSALNGRSVASVCSGDSAHPDTVIGKISSVVNTQLMDLAVSPDGAYLYVTDNNDFTVKVLQTSSMSVDPSSVPTIPVGLYPHGVAVAPDGQHIYVCNVYSGTVSVIQKSDSGYTVSATIDVRESAKYPYGVAMTPDGIVYVSNLYSGSGTVTVIDTSDNTVSPINGFDKPRYLTVAPDGQHVYACGSDSNTVSAINTSNKAVTMISVGTTHRGIGVTPDGIVYVSNQDDGTVSAIKASDIENGSYNPDDPDNTTISVGSCPTGVAVMPGGKYVYVSNFGDDTVSVIQTSDNTVKTITDVGDGPDAITVSPDGAYVYVGNAYANTITVIGNSDGT